MNRKFLILIGVTILGVTALLVVTNKKGGNQEKVASKSKKISERELPLSLPETAPDDETFMQGDPPPNYRALTREELLKRVNTIILDGYFSDSSITPEELEKAFANINPPLSNEEFEALSQGLAEKLKQGEQLQALHIFSFFGQWISQYQNEALSHLNTNYGIQEISDVLSNISSTPKRPQFDKILPLLSQVSPAHQRDILSNYADQLPQATAENYMEITNQFLSKFEDFEVASSALHTSLISLASQSPELSTSILSDIVHQKIELELGEYVNEDATNDVIMEIAMNYSYDEPEAAFDWSLQQNDVLQSDLSKILVEGTYANLVRKNEDRALSLIEAQKAGSEWHRTFIEGYVRHNSSFPEENLDFILEHLNGEEIDKSLAINLLYDISREELISEYSQKLKNAGVDLSKPPTVSETKSISLPIDDSHEVIHDDTGEVSEE